MMSTQNLLIFFNILFAANFLVAQDNNLSLANDKLLELAADLNYAEEDVNNPVVSDHYTSQGITHIYFQQTVNQIGVFGTNASVHIKNNEVFSSNINFLKGLSKREIKNQFEIEALEAIARLAEANNYPLSQTEILIIDEDEDDPEQPTRIFAAGISNRIIPLQLVFLENDEQDLQLAWSVFIDELDGANYKNFLVNASTGAIEKEIKLTVSCNFDHDHSSHEAEDFLHTNRLNQLLTANKAEAATNEKIQVANSYNVYPIPYESPNFVNNRSIVTSPWNANTTASPNGWHQIGTTSYTTTKGNNVDAYEDSNNNNQPSNGDAARVDGGPTLDFNNPLNLSTAPSANKPAAITNLFYWNNIIHDVWYNYGFDEPSGNFQEDNFGRGGNGGDYVYAEAQDGSGSCNANMSTPSDGGNPRMQMYVCNGRDGDFDNGVIVHEYGHGISIRLTGGPSTSSCLNNQEQMGEGWSDWFGTVMTIQAGDVATKSRPMGTWLFGQGPTGGGIRPYPYNTNMAVNPMTYGTLPASNISVPHGVGSVWATMLWDLTWAMIDLYGWDADLYNGTGGNNKTMALVILALKLQPCSPGFVDGRDAILAADRLLYGGDHQCLIWETFARRGLGYSANQGSTTDKSDGTEAFDMPPSCTISLVKTANKTTAGLGEAITYSLVATNEQSVTLTNMVFTDFLPADLEFVSASDNGVANNQTITWPAITVNPGERIERTVTAKVRTNLEAIDPNFIDDLESGTTNWLVTTDNGTGTWNYTTARSNSGSNAYYAPGASPDSYTNLTTAIPYGLTDQSELIFHHYYDIEANWDAGVIEISTDNGANWEDLGGKISLNGYHGNTFYGYAGFHGNSNGWVETKVDLSDYANQKAIIRFQMRHDFSVSEEGWYIDDINITNLGLSVINEAQIANSTLTSSTTVANPTQVDFDKIVCLDGVTLDLNNEIPTNDYRFTNDLISSGIIKNGATVNFYAGNSITLQSGFIAEAGSNFLAKIEACESGETSVAETDPVHATARNESTIHTTPFNNSKHHPNEIAVRPNPFSHTAIIDYQLAQNSKLWIGLHDITGKVVKVLHHQNDSPAGAYQLVLQGEQLESGAYWLTMQTQSEILTKKLFLVK